MNNLYTGGVLSSSLRGLLKQRNLTRTAFAVLMTLFSVASLHAQTIAAYTVTRGTNGYYAPVTSGLTDYFATGTGRDDVAGSVVTIPFSFSFAGTAYTQFSANSNGQIRLGATTIQGTNRTAVASQALIVGLGGDNGLSPTGSVTHYVSGTAPNRVFVIQYSNMVVPYNNYLTSTNYCSFQVWLEEGTNIVRKVYGPMIADGATSRQFFISSAAASTTNSRYISGTTGVSTAGTALTINGTAAGAFPFVNGGADGSRVVYTYNPTTTPPTVSAPTGLTSPSQTSSSINLSWTDASNEHGYVLYYSTASAAFNTSGITSNSNTQGKLLIAANATTASITGISSSSPYYIKLFAVRGDTSAAATTTATLPEEDVYVSAVSVNQASTGAVIRSQTNVPLLRLDVSTGGNANSYYLSSLNVSLPGATVVGTISGLRVYRTTGTTFNTNTPLSSGLISLTTNSLTINAANAGSVLETPFTAGTNYIWIAGDIASNAAYGATADLRIQGTSAISFSSGDVTPTTPNPTGDYTVGAFFDFETSDGPFININENVVNGATGTAYDWVLSNMPASGTALGGGLTLPGVRAGSTGSRVWGTNSTSAVTLNLQDVLNLHDIFSIPLTATGNVTFNFWNWWSLESTSTAYDNVFFFYRINGGSWVSASTTANGLNQTAGWTNRTITVPSAAGNTVELRMSYEGDSPAWAGYFFDDMTIAGIVIDEVAPSITINAATSTSATGNRTLTALATITDNVSLNNTTFKPRLYYKKSSQANNSTFWKFVEASGNTGNDYNFVLDVDAIGGVTAGDFVQYFVVAQDNAIVPNVSSSAVLTGSVSSVALASGNFPTVSGVNSYEILTAPRSVGSIAFDQTVASAAGTALPSVPFTPLMRILINVDGSTGTLNLTELVANYSGTLSASEISRIRVMSTGTVATFTNPVNVGNIVQTISGNTVTFNAANSGTNWPYSLNPGANYFWIAAGLTSTATGGSTMDISIPANGITIDGSTYPASIASPAGSISVINAFNFEGGFSGFSNASSNTFNWVLTTMPASGVTLGGGSSFPGPRSGSGGTRIIGTNASDAVTTNTGSSGFNSPSYGTHDLVSAPFVATGAVTATFWEWYSLEDSYDFVQVQYSTNNGSTWTTAYAVNASLSPNNWVQKTINVPSADGDLVKFRWRYAGDSFVYAGYFFDDFSINAATLADNTAPTISLASVANTVSTNNRTITGLATIADNAGGYGLVTSGSTAPRLFYKRSTDPNTSASWKSVAASNAASPFNFTFDYSLLTGGVTTGSIVQYFVVAQDAAPTTNVAVSPGVVVGGSLTSVNLAAANLNAISGTIPSFEIIAGPLTLENSVLTHPNATASRGTANQVLGRIELQVSGSLNTLNLTGLTVNSNSTNLTTTNVSNFKLFFTGNSATFATTTQVGSTVQLTGTGSSATVVFSGLSRALAQGSNYVWVTADIPSTAAALTTLDIQLNANSVSVTDGTTPATSPLAVSSPAGTVQVILPTLPNLAYTVARSTGVEYTSIVGQEGTNAFNFSADGFASQDDDVSAAISLGSLFNGFSFQGQILNSIAVSTNGHMQFNPDFGLSNTYQNDFVGAIRNSFAPLYDDLYCGTSDPASHMFYRIDGNSGTRVLTVEWIGMEQFGHAGPDLNFQVKLYEADDRIEYVYGTMVGFNGSADKAYNYTVGVFGTVLNSGQTTTTPIAGQYISQRFQNTNNFQNATYNSALTVLPVCNSRLTFTPAGSFTNGSSSEPTISNALCGAATPISLTFGSVIDNCNVYRSVLYSGTAPTPAVCTTGVSGGADDAAWFSFYNDSPRDVVVLVNASGGFAPAIQIASNCSTALACSTTTTQGGVFQMNYTGLGVGTFYVRVHHNGTGVSGTPALGGSGSGMFTMSVYTTASAPINDTCTGALTLTPNATETLGSTLNATSQGASAPAAGGGSGANASDDDVWYKFTATTTIANILSRGVAPFIPIVEIWNTGCPNGTTDVANRIGLINPTSAVQQTLNLTGLTIGQTYYIRVYHRTTGAPASGSRQFYLQVSLPRPSCPTLVNLASAPSASVINTPGLGGRPTTNVSYDSSTVYSWNRVSFDGTISYRYYFGTSSTPADNLFTTTSDSSYITPVLADGATYYFQVRTVSSTNGESVNCSNTSFTTKIRPGVPVCPTLSAPLANAVTSSTPTITWGAVANAFRYSVVIATDAGFTSIVYNNTNVSGGLTSFTIPAGSLLGNTNYFVRVTPRNSVNVTPSVTCNAVSFRTEVANNNAAGAIALTFASSCSTTAATSTGASASSVTNGVGVSGANDDDVWFSFVPTTQNVTISVTGGTTAGTLQNPVIELALSNGTTFATFDGNTGATEIGSANVPFVDGRNYLVRVYSRSINVTNAGTFNICVIGAATLTGNNTISGNYGSVTVSNGNTLTINGTTTVGNLTIETGGTLIVQGSNVVSGNTFTLAAGANLQIGSPAGITSGTSATGNIQFAVRNFSNDANYVYNGSAAQATGTGLPTRVRNLTINNSNGVTLTSNTSVAEVLNIVAGTFACGSNNFTFLSSPTVTARLSQIVPGTSAITGTNFTVERNAGVYNGSSNTVTGGYYFLGTPVTGATLSNWSVSGRFNQVFTGLTRSTYTYDATAGWASGTAATAMEPGTGAQIWADQSLQRNNIPFAINGNGIATGDVNITGTAANATTFRLVANPYPSAINFGSVQAVSTNIDNTFWVWSHAIRNYIAVTNGNGTVPVSSGGLDNDLASSQGFFVKATAAGAYSVNFRETHKTSESNVAIARVQTNPAIRMSLRGGNNVTSLAAIFFQSDATRNFDSRFDGRLLSSTVNISTWSADSQRLSINALPTPVATDSVGINVSVSLAGTYTLSFTELSNLPAGMRVFLKDRNNGSLSELTAGFTFDVVLEANANTDRFVLVYTPANVNSVSNNLGKELVSLFPNPSNSGNFTVRTSGFNAENATVIITDAVGKTVHTQTIEVGLTPVNNTVNANLAAGVYNVTCTSGTARVTTKLVVNK